MPLDETNQAQFEELHKRIHDSISADHEERWKQTFGFGKTRMPKQGMFVKTGPHSGSLIGSIGWVAQVRLKQGLFGSDNFILCHAGNGGWLMQHSNNHFFPLTPDEIEQVRSYFSDCLPDNAIFPKGIHLGSEETRAIGFIIEPPDGFETRGGEGARMLMTTISPDGTTCVSDTVFL